MLDFDGGIVGDAGKFGVERFDNFHGVLGAVEEIGIAEGHVLGSGGDLLAEVGEDRFPRDDAELPLIHGHDGAVPAEMLAASAGFGVGD